MSPQIGTHVLLLSAFVQSKPIAGPLHVLLHPIPSFVPSSQVSGGIMLLSPQIGTQFDIAFVF